MNWGFLFYTGPISIHISLSIVDWSNLGLYSYQFFLLRSAVVSFPRMYNRKYLLSKNACFPFVDWVIANYMGSNITRHLLKVLSLIS